MKFSKQEKTLYTTAIIVVLLDLITKTIIRLKIGVGESIDLFPWLGITNIPNWGVAFGMLQFEWMRWIFVIIALGVAIIIAYSCKHNKLTSHFVIWGLIMGGAIGNALDRIFVGTVTDFINLSFWPAFNIADTALTIGIILLIIHAFREE